MADYTLTHLRTVGDTDIYEVRLPDGTASQFAYTNAQKKCAPSKDEFDRWVAIAVKRAQRSSDYIRAVNG